MKILLTREYSQAICLKPDFSIGAVYDGHVIEGSKITLVEHDAKKPEQALCMLSAARSDVCYGTRDLVLVRQLDLNTLGGLATVLVHGVAKDFGERQMEFWKLVAKMHIEGLHWMPFLEDTWHSGSLRNQFRNLWAAVAASEEIVEFPAGSRNYCARKLAAANDHGWIHDVTELVFSWLNILSDIIRGDSIWTESGQVFEYAYRRLEASSVSKIVESSVIVRVSERADVIDEMFSSRAATYPLVVSTNLHLKNITLSKVSDDVPVNCLKILSLFYGFSGVEKASPVYSGDARKASVKLVYSTTTESLEAFAEFAAENLKKGMTERG